MASNRERFEEWYLAEFWEGSNGGRAMLKKEPCGGYTYAKPQELWKVWLAAQPAAGEPADLKELKSALLDVDIAIKFALCNRDLIGTREDVKKAAKAMADLDDALTRFVAAQPAAAHGDEAVRFESPEALAKAISDHCGYAEVNSTLVAGRIFTAMRAQAGEGLLFTDAILPGGISEGGDA